MTYRESRAAAGAVAFTLFNLFVAFVQSFDDPSFLRFVAWLWVDAMMTSVLLVIMVLALYAIGMWHD